MGRYYQCLPELRWNEPDVNLEQNMTSGVWIGDMDYCLKKGPRPIGGMPSDGIFLRDPSPYLPMFWRKPRKTPKG